MKVIDVNDARARLGTVATQARRQRIVLTRGGLPVALVVGLDGYDAEQIARMTDPAFWQLIESRRRERTVSLTEARRRLGLSRPSRTRRKRS